MVKVEFLKLILRNFLSVGNEEVAINFKTGLHIIRGINHDEEEIGNGVGKSVIIDGISYVIYGKTMRNLTKKSLIVNRKNRKNCLTGLNLKVNDDYYEIRRGISPNFLTLHKNGEDISLSSVADTTKYIINLLNLNEEIFQNCLMMRSNDTIPFMHKKPSDRKSFIESIFSFSILSDMLKSVRGDNNEIKRNLDTTKAKKEVSENGITNFKNQITLLKEEKEKKDKESDDAKKSILLQIEEEKGKIDENQKQLDEPEPDTSKVEEQIEKGRAAETALVAKISKIESNIENSKKEISKIEKSGLSCPFCHRDYDEKQQQEAILNKKKLQDEQAALDDSLKDTEKMKKKVSDKLNELRETRKKTNKTLVERLFAEERIKTAKKNIESLKKRLNDLEKDDSFYIQTMEDNLKKQEEELKKIETDLNVLEEKRKIYNACEIILGEDGVRKYIVNKLLKILNERIDFYLRSFKSMFDFSFDEVFEDKIIDSLGTECCYNNCSGAEMKKIDLAISFAFLDILKIQEQTDYNIRFFDEILDSSMDSKTLEMVMKFIGEQTTKQNKATYIITHKSDIKLPEITSTILLEKKNGYTFLGNSSN